MTPSPKPTRQSSRSAPNWNFEPELVGLVFELCPTKTGLIPLQYTVGFHAWFLDQVRQIDPELSASLHDGESEKAFTISGLEGTLIPQGQQLRLEANQIYRWYITGLSLRVVQWMAQWVKALPEIVELRQLALQIRSCQVFLPATTYKKLAEIEPKKTITLTFLTPTSFRRHGHHFPLPTPVNLFHSYLRRWNDFSGIQFDQEAFLEWVDETVIIVRHQLQSVKVAAGKKGSVTGFTGAIELGLSSAGRQNKAWTHLFYTLAELAPYCGTGHKTTFGLGQTRLCWLLEKEASVSSLENVLAERISQLTEIFTAQRKHTGGTRTSEIVETWATILARRELGESLQVIAADLEMPYETVKTYVKLARRALKQEES